MAGALRVLETCRRRHRLDLEVQILPVGGQSIDRFGQPLTAEVLAACKSSGVVLLGAVGDPRFDGKPPDQRPEKALLALRRELGLFANLRPIRVRPALAHFSPLRKEIVKGIDILFVRELTGGIYFGQPRGRRQRGCREAFNTEIYADYEIERIARVAFEAGRERRRRVTSVDKSNVLESSQLWREIVEEVALDYSDVELRHMLVDNCAMQLIADPGQFDVVLTNNIFGDILSDEAAMLTGSIGMLPSASLGAEGAARSGLFEPVHGSAPDIAGQGKANPMATIESLALLFRHSLGRDDVAREIEAAVGRTLDQSVMTPDLAGAEGVSTSAVVEQVVASLG